MFFTTLSIGATSLILLCTHWYIQGLRKVNYTPGYRQLLAPSSLAGAVIPTNFWNLGYMWPWIYRESSFFNFTHDIISIVPVLTGKASYYTCSVDVLKQLLGNENKTRLVKPLDITLDDLLGPSLASASGDVWRRHRRVVAPAFHTKIFTAARAEAANIYNEMMQAEEWSYHDQVSLPEVNQLMLKFSLLMIGRCGFGIPMPWSPEKSKHNKLSFEESVLLAAETLMPRVILPSWAFKLPIQKLREIDHAWESFTRYTKRHIRENQAEVEMQEMQENSEGAGYILRRLVASSGEGAGKFSLTEQEVMADIFTIMFAGHETTGSVLTATLGYLAIHQGEQEKAYMEVMGRASSLGILDIDEPANLAHLMACFIEAGRLFPAALMLARTMAEDTPIKVERPLEETVVLPKGSRIIFEIIGMLRNPNTYQNPGEFIPSRWYGVAEPDLPMFGFGPRGCVGRKFAITEAVTFLAYLLRDWRLDIKLKEGETRAQYEARVMGVACNQGTAFSVGPVALELVRRS
ncbi:cytochrome P450 [Gautieria morchelliformis]|nr:cytochrome P450 [Gautieria morchelliformis]